ncbi:MAG: hypothetical protein P4N59_02985 [Negativicutes bacterium]|nr:hypothetical protein [Formivibrio sp.]MDR3560396.1 hypothetical protein [Negativicutes bacterium]
MSKFQPYQTVRVVRVPSRADASWSGIGSRLPQVGDTGAVVEVYSDPHEAYCVEAVLPDGRTEWLVDFLPEELELV